MALQVGRGGRGLLVALGMALMAFAAVRAEWITSPLSRQGREGGAAHLTFIYGLPIAACERELRIATPPRAAALRLGAGIEVVAAEHGGAALARFAAGDADGALVSVAELAAGLPREAWIAQVLGAGADLALVAERELRRPATIAAPPGSAEAFLAEAAGGQAVRAEDPRQALALLGGGRAAAAAVPRWRMGPAGPIGKPAELQLRGPLDPMVLVVGARARCVGQEPGTIGRGALERALGTIPPGLADAPGSEAMLVRAWAAQRMQRPALPPLELLVTPALAESIWGGKAGDEGILPAASEGGR